MMNYGVTQEATCVAIEVVSAPYGDDMARAGQIANRISQGNAFTLYREELAPNTKRRQRNDLQSFSSYLASAGIQRAVDDLALDAEAWRGMQHGLLRGFVRWLRNAGYSTGSINVRLATIRQYCRLAGPIPEGAGVIDENDLAAILTVRGYNDKRARNLDRDRQANDIPTRRGHKKAQPIELSTAQALQLKKTTTTKPGAKPARRHDRLIAARDGLLVGFLIEHALRCGEVVALNIESIDLLAGTFTFTREKTDIKPSTHRMKQHTRLAAEAYLKQLQEQDPSRTTGPLFTGYSGARISTRGVNDRIATLGRAIGVEKLSPHDLRHFWAFDAFRNDTPIDRVKAGGGWKTAAMPMRYAERAGIDNEGVFITEESQALLR